MHVMRNGPDRSALPVGRTCCFCPLGHECGHLVSADHGQGFGAVVTAQREDALNVVGVEAALLNVISNGVARLPRQVSAAAALALSDLGGFLGLLGHGAVSVEGVDALTFPCFQEMQGGEQLGRG